MRKTLLTVSILILSFLAMFVLMPIEIASAQAENQSDKADSQVQEAQEKQFQAALRAAVDAAIHGPSQVDLIDQGTLAIPEGYVFIPAKEASDLMLAIGNRPSSDYIGMLASEKDGLRWYISVFYIKSGFMKDEDAKNWNKDELLKIIKKDTQAENEDRIAKGFPAIENIDWIEPPTYDSIKRQLFWSILAREVGSQSQSANYNAFVLGREGLFRFLLITSNGSIKEDKLHVHKLLSVLTYNKDKRYEDFVAKTDHVAEYGLAALITGIAAKKLGLLAMASVFLIKMWKLMLLIPLLFFNKIKGFFKRKSN